MGTDTLDNVVDRGHTKAIGNVDQRNGRLLQTVGAMALFAVEMDVQVIILVVAVAMAEFIAHAASAVVDDMDQMMLAEEGQRTEDARLVDRQDLVLQFGERQRAPGLSQSLSHDNAIGRGLDAVVHQ